MLKKSLIISFYLINSIAFATDVLIWEPNDEHRYGHAALQTKTYHISLWPDGDLKQDYNSLGALTGVTGSLNFHESYDNYLEGYYNYDNGKKTYTKGRLPERISLKDISARLINQKYEELLEFNNITPDKVTIEAGLEKVKSNDEVPSITLSKSLYSFKGEFFHKSDFYKSKQSCTTLCMGLLLNAGAGGGYYPYDSFEKQDGVPADIIEIPMFKKIVKGNFQYESNCNIS